ncbi:MAG TPA: fumarylacetoacetase [Sphingobium sp.]
MNFPPLDETHDPARRSWVDSANGHADFPVQNLPFGIFSPRGGEKRAGAAIGDQILDLEGAAAAGLLPQPAAGALHGGALNELLALPAADRRELRRVLGALLSEDGRRDVVEPLLHRAADCAMHLPAVIGDYTDFYVGIHHATNIGRLFRPDNPLLPNYKYVPIGYHGRSSSIRPSGVAVKRPMGQRKTADADTPVMGPTVRLDYELELGIWVGPGNALGEPTPIAEAAAHVAGFCLLNDWSARDFQAWEYVPLGPFLAKNFHTTISPWIVTAEAMAPFRIAQPARAEGDPQPLPYLWDEGDQAGGALSIELEAYLSSATMQAAGMAPVRLSKGTASAMYWTAQQILTHHASNGCNLNPGDLLGSGTLSGPERESYGSLMELTEGGARTIALPGGEARTFLENGDEVVLKAVARAEGYAPIGFGECRAVISPAG